MRDVKKLDEVARGPRSVRVLWGLALSLGIVALVNIGVWVNHWYVAHVGLRPHAVAGEVELWRDLYEMLESGNVSLARGLSLLLVSLAEIGRAHV